jgi:SARP family transcriptional regulator, regulator of embCAB operon
MLEEQLTPSRGHAMNDEPGQIKIRLLGVLTAYLDGTQVTPSAAKQRQILALLALNSGRVVTIGTLVEELWGDRPPRSSATTLQTYVMQLRNRLAEAAPGSSWARGLLRTQHGGYMLEEAACRTDIDEFGRLSLAGRTAAETGDYRAAAERLGHALALWRGPALADVRLGCVLELEATSLEETRLGVLERRIEADLALGRHADLLGELTLLTARNPMNENFCALLMTALYRSGHVERALKAYHRVRTVLRDELGIEPYPRLRRLQRAILSGDPALESGLPGRHAAALSN